MMGAHESLVKIENNHHELLLHHILEVVHMVIPCPVLNNFCRVGEMQFESRQGHAHRSVGSTIS